MGVRLLFLLIALLAAARAGAQDPPLIVEASPFLEPAARRVRGLDRAALSRTLSASGLPMPGRIVVTLIPREDPDGRRVPPWIVGLASGTSRIVVFPDRIGGYPYDSLETVVRHEIVHLALNTRADGHPLPRWFHEGVALTLESGWGTRDDMRLLLAALDPPSLADIGRLFASDSQPDSAQAYLLSGALVDDIRRRHGAGIVGAIAGGVAAGGTFEGAFRAATGETVDDAAARAWRGHRRLSRWFPVITSPAAVWTLILALAAVAFGARVRRRRETRRRWEADADDDEDPGP
jgi:hypothetical protein